MAGQLLPGMLCVFRMPVYGGPQASRMMGGFISRDMEYGGRAYIAGEPPDGLITNELNQPIARPVWLHDSVTMRPVRRTFSAADGTYRFDLINPRLEYVVIARDDRRVDYSAIADRITPVEPT